MVHETKCSGEQHALLVSCWLIATICCVAGSDSFQRLAAEERIAREMLGGDAPQNGT